MVNPVRASEILNKIKLSLLCFSVTHRSFAFHSLYKTQGRFIYTIYREKYHYWFSKNFLHVLTIVLLRVREAVEYITPPGGRVREQQIGDRRAPLLTKIKRAKLVGSLARPIPDTFKQISTTESKKKGDIYPYSTSYLQSDTLINRDSPESVFLFTMCVFVYNNRNFLIGRDLWNRRGYKKPKTAVSSLHHFIAHLIIKFLLQPNLISLKTNLILV